MSTKRLRRIGYFVVGVVLALISPIDEILIVAAVSSILYRFVRRKLNERYSKASGVSSTDANRR